MRMEEVHARIASHLVPCNLGAIYGTRRNIVLRLGKRDVEGGQDDWEGEGKLEHVCPNRCSRCGAFTLIGKGPIYPLWPRECAEILSANAILQRVDVRHRIYTLTALRRCMDGILCGYRVSGHGTIPLLSGRGQFTDHSSTQLWNQIEGEGKWVWTSDAKVIPHRDDSFHSDQVAQGLCHSPDSTV
jgi:hypothetical protein